jgi:hypothetical protein
MPSALNVPPKIYCSLDVRLLLSLVAAAQQENDRTVAQSIVDAITRTYVDSQFPHTITAKSVVAEIAGGQSVETPKNGSASPFFAQFL